MEAIDDIKPRLRVSTVSGPVALLCALAPYVMAFAPWKVDKVVFEFPAVACGVVALVLAPLTVWLALRGISTVPTWQEVTELLVGIAAAILLLVLLALW